NEFVFAVQGEVRPRPEGMINSNLATGEIEVVGREAKILNPSENLPFQIEDNIDVSENLRLKYRYLDLRRTKQRDAILTRIAFVKAMRRALEDENFLDIETPFLY